MANIKEALAQMPEKEKQLGNALIDFYERMKALESDVNRGGKQGVLIVMTMNDIQKIFD